MKNIKEALAPVILVDPKEDQSIPRDKQREL